MWESRVDTGYDMRVKNRQRSGAEAIEPKLPSNNICI